MISLNFDFVLLPCSTYLLMCRQAKGDLERRQWLLFEWRLFLVTAKDEGGKFDIVFTIFNNIFLLQSSRAYILK